MTTSSLASSNPYAFLNGTTTSTSGTSSTSGTTASSTSSSSSSTSASSMQNQFLTLLVKQLETQDPSNPMDNSAITSQMAEISQVTGLQQLNTTMTSLLQVQTASQSMVAASMIGGQVLVPGNSMTLDSNGDSVNAGVSLSAAAQGMTISVKNSSGTVVDTMTVANPSSGMNNFSWDGKDSNGNQLPAGNYTFSTQLTQATNATTAATATSYANQTVSAVSWSSGSPQLVLANGTSVPVSSVMQLSS